MVITKPNDIDLFYKFRKGCENLHTDMCYPVCIETGRICDEDECPIVKRCNDIDEFIDIIKRS